MKLIRIYRRRHDAWRNGIVLLVVDLAGLLDILITVCSLTLLCSDYRAAVLFSDWAEDFGARN